MPAMQVGGLASGLDTNSIIAQLTALEQAKVTREVQKKEKAENTLEKFKELETRLGNLQQKAKSLELPKDFNVFKASSNYEENATISGGEGATAGQYELVIHQLATTQKVASESFDAINTPMSNHANWGTPADNTVTITLSLSEAAKKADPRKEPVEVKISGSDTLKDIVNKINAAEGSGVKASIMSMANGENRLILTAVDTGTNGFYLGEDIGTNFLGGVLGIINNDEQKATSSGSLLTKDGIADENTTFDKLDTGIGKNNQIYDGDKIGIYLPTDAGTGSGGWQTFDLYDTTGKAKTIGDVLGEINTALASAGANFTASLNNSGEIVLEGDLAADPNFNSSVLKNVKIQMGTFKGTKDVDEEPDKVKKDMGSLTNRNIFTNVITEAQNSFYTIDGIAISSQSNNDDKTIMGTTFTLKKADPDKTIKLSLEPDMSALADKIGAFIEEFNALLKFIDENSKATIKEETNKETGQKTNTRVVGAFTGDSGISGLRDNLRNMLSGTINEITGLLGNGYSTVYSSASRLGIITNREGYFDVDKEKLTKALNADFEGVRRLFTSNGFSDTTGFNLGRFGKDSQAGIYEYKNGEWYLNGDYSNPVKGTWFENSIFTTDKGLSIEVPNGFDSFTNTAKFTFVRGIAGQISNFVEKAKSGYYSEQTGRFVDGFFKQSKDTYQKRIEEIQKRVDQLQTRVDNYNMRLVKQFSALERSMSNLQAQSANMMSALSGISYKR
jgi:flagellar capping protein FliD